MTNRPIRSIIYSVADGGAFGSIAQLVEHLPYKQGVTGSSPVVPTNAGCIPVVSVCEGATRRRVDTSYLDLAR